MVAVEAHVHVLVVPVRAPGVPAPAQEADGNDDLRFAIDDFGRMPMKKSFFTAIAIVIILLVTPFTAQAQSYSFSLDQEDVIVFLNEDSSISLDYTFVFTNDSGAHEIDFVDVGMPNSSFDIEDVSAEVNGTPVDVSVADYQGGGSGFAVVLGAESIQPGETGTVHVTVERIAPVLNRDSQDATYASFEFTPTWFGSNFVHGNTDLSVAFHLPPGIQTEEPRFHLPDDAWTGDKEPVSELDENGRIIYIWHAENANGYTPYVFGASFPLNYVPAYATELAQPTVPPPTQPARPTTSPQADGNALAGWIIAGTVFVLIIGVALFLQFSESRDDRFDYLPPQISIEGYGIKRGLTAVEAAVVLEQPLEKILTMILFGIVKKGAAKITKRDPLQLDIAATLPEDLHAYEKDFLNAFRIEDARNREEKLQEMFIDLIKAVSEKLKGFSRDETQLYYRGMIQRAWQQVREAGTPEVKNQEFDQNFDWLMLNYRFGEDVQELFKDPGMTTPQWWSAYDQGFKLPDNHLPTLRNQSSQSDTTIDPGRPIFHPRAESSSTKSEIFSTPKPGSSALPGADYAASIVNSVQDFSSKVISDVGKFTDRVHKVTNLRSVYSPESDPIENILKYRKEERTGGSSASSDGFFSLFGGSSSGSSSSSSSHHTSSHSSSSSHHSSCACACAGCACACAGGGR